MRITAFSGILAPWLLCSGIAMLYANQVTIIEAEADKVNEKLTRQGFVCRGNVVTGTGDRFDFKAPMDKNTLYYIAIITGRGETVVHPQSITLVNQNKKVIPLELQNTPFGSEVKLHPLTNGNKEIRVVLKQKTSYSVTLCTNTASLFHTEQKNSPLDDHGHF